MNVKIIWTNKLNIFQNLNLESFTNYINSSFSILNYRSSSVASLEYNTSFITLSIYYVFRKNIKII